MANSHLDNRIDFVFFNAHIIKIHIHYTVTNSCLTSFWIESKALMIITTKKKLRKLHSKMPKNEFPLCWVKEVWNVFACVCVQTFLMTYERVDDEDGDEDDDKLSDERKWYRLHKQIRVNWIPCVVILSSDVAFVSSSTFCNDCAARKRPARANVTNIILMLPRLLGVHQSNISTQFSLSLPLALSSRLVWNAIYTTRRWSF